MVCSFVAVCSLSFGAVVAGVSFSSGAAGAGEGIWLSAVCTWGLFKSMCPTSVMRGRRFSGTVVFISSVGADGLGARVLFVGFLRSFIIFSALLRRSLSAPNSFFSRSYCSSVTFSLGNALISNPFFCRKSTTVCSPTLNSLITLFSLMLICYYSSSNSAFKMRKTSSTVPSSRSAFSMSISRGAFSTSLAVLRPMPLMASMTHWSISSANSSR